MSLRLTKPSVQKRLHEIPSPCWTHGPAAHTEDVHVVVLDTLSRRKMVVNQSSPDALDFVCADRSTNAASANRHSSFSLLPGYSFRQGNNIIGIIIGVTQLMCTEIDHFMSRSAQLFDQLFL